jgi:O-antigen/teichoic acid export membrane protein
MLNTERHASRAPVTLDKGGTSLRARVARSIFWLAWSRGVLQLFSFATTVLIARILVPADYGVMALASAFIGTANMLAEMGIGRAIIQFRDLDRRELDTCFWLTMVLAIIGFVILSLGASTIGDWFAEPRLAEVLPVLALSLPLTACAVVSDGLLRRQLALDRVSQAELIGGTAALPVMLCCALAGLDVWALVIGSLVHLAVRSLAIFAFAPWCPGLRVGGERIKEMLRFSVTTLGANLLWTLGEQADVLVIGKITGQVTLGLYSMARQLALLPSHKISTVVNMLSSPMMAELQENIDAMRGAFYRTVRLTAAITLPISAGMALVAAELVSVVLGPRWSASAPLFRLLCFYAALRAIDVLLAPVLVARHRERLLFWYCVVLLIAVPAAAALGALWGGAPGAVILMCPVYCGVMAITAGKALTELQGSFTELLSETWRVLVATAAMAAVVLLIKGLAFAGQRELPILDILVLSFGGALTYGATLYSCGSSTIGELVEVIGWIFRRRRGDY